MGDAKPPKPVKLICAVLAGREEWFDRARALTEEAFGPVDLTSDTWPFGGTDYYEPEMGPVLLRRIYSFSELADPGAIVRVKLRTNELERQAAAEVRDGPRRPMNLDAGYVSQSKLVLATTKDYTHRLYLGDGVYAEVTLRWRRGAFEPWEWTYPDYRMEHCREFFARVRALYVEQLRSGPPAAGSGPRKMC